MDNDFIRCPNCGETFIDFDGLSFSFCQSCGYCSHINSQYEADGREFCGICRREIRRMKLRENVYKTIEMDGQKVLSVKNPWAYLIMYHGKNIENRKRRIGYRGPILIHASKTGDMSAYEILHLHREREEIEKSNGHILGQITLTDCVNRPPCSPWAEIGSPWFWVLESPRPFDRPLPARGMLGLWTYGAKEIAGKIDGNLF